MRVPNVRQLGVVSALCLGSFALGSALHLPAMATQVYQQYLSPNTTCNSSSPCTSTTNNGSGPASANTSVGGTALTGTTQFNSTSKTKFAVGVLGSDKSTKGLSDIGVEGTSVSGTGTQGTTKSGIGVNGTATTGTGVSGTSANIGVVGSGALGVQARGNGAGSVGLDAIAIASANGTGVESIALGTGGVGVSTTGGSVGLQASGPTAILAQASTSGNELELDSSGSNLVDGFNSGNLVFSLDNAGDIFTAASITAGPASFSTSGDRAVGAEAFEEAVDGVTTDSTSTLGAIRAFTTGGYLFEGVDNSRDEFVADGKGNLTLAGQLFTNGSCHSGCIAHGPGQKRVVSYTPRESQPTMEDFGEAQLVDGEAHVALDPAFANVIDENANYFVFMTPDGDCNGLFIAGKTPTGFIVRELRGGHSSLGFEYRIVAKPFGDHSPRLPMVAVRSEPMPYVAHVIPHLKPAQRIR
jgi:hypothetical protein